MSNITKLIASLAVISLILLLSAITVHLVGEYPKNLDVVLSLTAGLLGVVAAVIGFFANRDNPWVNR